MNTPTHTPLSQNHLQQLLNETELIGKVGGWEFNIDTLEQTWTEEVYRIHEVDVDFRPTVEKGVAFYTPETRPVIEKAVRRAIELGEPFDVELPFITAKGNRRWVRAIGEADLVHRRVHGFFQDITERKKMEEELLKAVDAWQATFDSVNDAIWILDGEQRILRSNKAAERILGKPLAEMIGRHCWEIVHGTSEPIPECPVVRAVKTLKREQMEIPLGERYYHVTADPMVDDKGTLAGVIHIVSDVTKRKLAELELLSDRTAMLNMLEDQKRAEEELRQSNALLEESQRIARLGSYVFDVSGGKWSSSPALDEIFGISGRTHPRSVDGWLAIVHPEERAAIRSYLMDNILVRREPFDREYRIVQVSSGAELWVHGLGRLTLDTQGHVIRMIGTIQDITERKRAEAEREKLQAQLVQAQKMESVGRLAGGVAHDFNNLLMAIAGYAELALEKIPPDIQVRECLDEIISATHRSAEITRQLLAYARKQTIEPRVFDVNDHIANMLNLLSRLLGADIQLNWMPGAMPMTVKMDPSQLDQVLANLVVNARDAIQEHGSVTIRTQTAVLDEAYCTEHPGAVRGDYVLLAVSDTGCGMDKTTLTHIFEPFFTTKSSEKGTGLGLATVYGIIKQNKGYIDAESEPGHGTTFTIYLPSCPVQTQGTDGATAPLPRGTENILLVEDEPSVRMTTQRFLESLGYAVLSADSPEQAQRLAAEHRGSIHLLLTDVVLPRLSGRELAEDIKKREPGIRHLFISGYTADVLGAHGVLDTGLNYLQKPFSRAQLARKVREILDPS